MTIVTDFYKFKYTKNCYYIDLLISRCALLNVEEALEERLCNLALTKDSQCAYMRLKEQFQNARAESESPYVELKINKCYLKYIKNLNCYFMDRYEYIPLKILNEYLQAYSLEDSDKISNFSILNEDIKVRILSNV